jgi:hypothetical protein
LPWPIPASRQIVIGSDAIFLSKLVLTRVQVAPAQLSYDFCRDNHEPADHLLRRIDRVLDLESIRTALKSFYSSIGRPSVDPELMMRMLIAGSCLGLRSERRLCGEVHHGGFRCCPLRPTWPALR